MGSFSLLEAFFTFEYANKEKIEKNLYKYLYPPSPPMFLAFKIFIYLVLHMI